MVDRPRFLRTPSRQEAWWRMYSHNWHLTVRITAFRFIKPGRSVTYAVIIERGKNRKKKKTRNNTNGDYSVYKIAVGLLLCTDAAARRIYGILPIDKNKSTPASRHEFLLPFVKIGEAFHTAFYFVHLKELRTTSWSGRNDAAEKKTGNNFSLCNLNLSPCFSFILVLACKKQVICVLLNNVKLYSAF